MARVSSVTFSPSLRANDDVGCTKVTQNQLGKAVGYEDFLADWTLLRYPFGECFDFKRIRQACLGTGREARCRLGCEFHRHFVQRFSRDVLT
jgi:hypothetical protein